MLILIQAYSQDSTNNNFKLFFRPYVKSGITFPNNNVLKDNYGTNSIFNWGVGFRFGNPNTQKILPFFDFTQSSYSFNYNEPDTQIDSITEINEFTFGIDIVIKRIKDDILKAKIGYIYSDIQDEIMIQESQGSGILFGLGYEIKVFRNSRFTLDLTYNYNKLSNALHRDYDNVKFSLGFMY